MARRIASIVTAVGLWSMAATMLAIAAAFLFAAVVHRAGSDGWILATVGTVALCIAGTACLGVGWWLASGRDASRATTVGDDDAMWLA